MDGDKKNEHPNAEYTIFYPVADLEKYMYQKYLDDQLEIDFSFTPSSEKFNSRSKDFFNQLLKKKYNNEILDVYMDIYNWELSQFDIFSDSIMSFINS